MLRTIHDLKKMALGATDGEIGEVKEAYFDDQEWALRYLVVDTGGWLPGRKVLITPLSIRGMDWDQRRIDVSLTREQVKNGPDIDTDKPVSRQHETRYFDYYGYPYYWIGPSMWGPVAFPAGTVTGAAAGAVPTEAESMERETRRRERENADPHLRSTREVSGYHLEAADGSIGHIDDFLFDDENWALRYLIIDTRNWLPGRRVLVSTEWVERVSWDERKAYVSLTRDAVRESPEYDSDTELTQEDETQLHQHYGRDFGSSSTRVQIR